MPKASKFSPDEGLTIYDLKDNEAVHYGDQSKGYVGKNLLNVDNAIYATNVVSGVSNQGIISFEDVGITWSNSFLGYFDVVNGKTYTLSTNDLMPMPCYRLGISNTPNHFPESGYFPNVTVQGGGLANIMGHNSTIDIVAKESSRIYLWMCTDYDIENKQAFNKGFMIRLASIPDSTYEPYLTPNTEIDNMYPNEANNILGAKNLLKIVNKPNSIAGITPQYNDDGSVFIAGGQTSTGEGGIQLINLANSYPLPVGDYIFTGTPKGFSWSSMCLYYDRRNNDNTGWDGYQKRDEGNGVVISVTEEKKNNKYIISIRIANGYTVPEDGILFKPMLRPLSVHDDTYASYAMTNMELTTKVQGIIDAATNAADFAAFKVAISAL